MIDPIDALAFSLHYNKGVYALLLGSGISRAAKIPTGWDIILDLTRKLAAIKGENCDADPEAWYKQTFGEEPNYSKLIQGLAKSQPERSQLLRGYFEPNQEERERKEKEPTAAHNAIANLVASGHIRVIITTNFDRLLEKALEMVGVVPTVISTPDALAGARPIQHTECTIIKLHGDYMDTRIRNTPQELEQYTRRINQVLDRVLDEYGLIICGWSGDWDTALRNAIERCQSHRFTTYWTARSKLKGLTGNLAALRRAEEIMIVGADEFFATLAEKVDALEELDRPHPLSIKMLTLSLKQNMGDHSKRIMLHDLVIGEADSLKTQLNTRNFPTSDTTPYSRELLLERLKRYEAVCERLQAVLITGCSWSEQEQNIIWKKALERIAVQSTKEFVANSAWSELTRYPALYLLYSGALSAMYEKRYSTVEALLVQARVQRDNRNEFQPMILGINANTVMNYSEKFLFEPANRLTSVSDYLHETLRPYFKELVPNDTEYDNLFDMYEYIQTLIYADHYEKQNNTDYFWGVMGRYVWRQRHVTPNIMKVIAEEATQAGDNWAPLTAGLFDGSLARFQKIQSAITDLVQRQRVF